MAKSSKHEVKVAKAYWMGGYAVMCSSCGKIGRGVDPDRKKAKQKAWTLAGKHRNKTGGVLGS